MDFFIMSNSVFLKRIILYSVQSLPSRHLNDLEANTLNHLNPV